jgi:hypothetical protein
MSLVFTTEQIALFQQIGLVPATNASLDEELQLQLRTLSPHMALRSVLDVEIKRVARGFPALASLSASSNLVLSGPFFVQVDALENANAPKRPQARASAGVDTVVDAPPTPRRCLRLRLCDGASTVDALEFDPIESLSFDATPPGTKLVLRNVRVQRGWLLLSATSVQVLGGRVEALEKLFAFQREVAARDRSLFAAHHAVRREGETGPPPFVLPETSDAPADSAETPPVESSRPSAKPKAKFAPMPAVAVAVAPSVASAAPLPAPAPAAAQEPLKRGKFAPMPITPKMAAAAASASSGSGGGGGDGDSDAIVVPPAASQAAQKRGKFAPMPITPKMAAASGAASGDSGAAAGGGRGRGRGGRK